VGALALHAISGRQVSAGDGVGHSPFASGCFDREQDLSDVAARKHSSLSTATGSPSR
jgi:hypothetical protein